MRDHECSSESAFSYCCRVCGASGRRKRSIVVHHRVPGKSVLHLMISLCPGCHAKVGRTRIVLSQMPALLLELWREQHPLGHEQTALDFQGQFASSQERAPVQTKRREDRIVDYLATPEALISEVGVIGRKTLKTVPAEGPVLDRTRMQPSCLSTIPFEIQSPRPVPLRPFVV